MQGVTILHEYQYLADYLWGLKWYSIACICVGVLLFVGMVYAMKHCYETMFGVCLYGCVIAIGLGLFQSSHAVPVYESRYKVLIDDACNITEFFDKYKILDKQGEIYIIKEIQEALDK